MNAPTNRDWQDATRRAWQAFWASADRAADDQVGRFEVLFECYDTITRGRWRLLPNPREAGIQLAHGTRELEAKLGITSAVRARLGSPMLPDGEGESSSSAS